MICLCIFFFIWLLIIWLTPARQLLPIVILFRSCFIFNNTATTEINTYLHTLSLHDALPIFGVGKLSVARTAPSRMSQDLSWSKLPISCIAFRSGRSEEHTSELQSLMRSSYAVFCSKKKKTETSRAVQQECRDRGPTSMPSYTSTKKILPDYLHSI